MEEINNLAKIITDEIQNTESKKIIIETKEILTDNEMGKNDGRRI